MGNGLSCAVLVIGMLGAGCAHARAARDGDGPFAPANGARADAATGLPTRVIHRPSGVALVLVPAGEFKMGSPETEEDRSKAERRHRRVIRKPFYLGETEVTVAQFRKFADAGGYQTDAERGVGEQGRGSFATVPDGEREWNATATWRNPFPNLPGEVLREDYPVMQVSWNDARAFAGHYGLRLPSEAEWEYAARAGSATRFPWGESDAGGKGRANVGDFARRDRFPTTNVFFPFDDGFAMLAPVGRFAPNAWGLRDMIGNVEEWVEDAHAPYPPDGADQSAVAGDANAARVLRGGAWTGNQGTSRAATRIGMVASSRRDFQGFRIAADAEVVLRDGGPDNAAAKGANPSAASSGKAR